jgi:hypothetical protein
MAIESSATGARKHERAAAATGAQTQRPERERDRRDEDKPERINRFQQMAGVGFEALGGNEIAEYALQAFNAVAKAEAVRPGIEFGFVAVPREADDRVLVYHCIAAYMTEAVTNRTLFLPIALEATGTDREPHSVRTRGVDGESERLEMHRVASEAYRDPFIYEQSRRALAARFPQSEIFELDGLVINRAFSIRPSDDKEVSQQQRIRQLVSKVLSMLALTGFMSAPGFVDASVDDIAGSSGAQFIARLDGGTQHTLDATGLPVFSNAVLRLISKPAVNDRDRERNRGPASFHSATATETVEGQVNLMVDALYLGDENASGYRASNRDDRDAERVFMPQVIVTDFQARRGVLTPSMVQLLLAGVPSLLRVDDIFRVLCSNSGETDIGSLGRVYEAGSAIDTSSPDFLTRGYRSMIQRMFYDRIAVFMDVPHAGITTPYLSVFERAVSTDKATREEAEDQIIASADALTDGRFSQKFKGERLFAYVRPVVMGHFTGRDGQLQDIRKFGLIAAGNVIPDTEDRAYDDYVSAMFWDDMNDIERIALMQKTITAITGHDARFTGMASRIRPLPDYLTALIEALEDTGAYPVREDGGSTLYRGRGYGSRDIKERSMENVGGWTSSRNAGGGRRYSRY